MSFKGYSFSYFLLCIIALLAMFSTQIINPLLSIYAKELGAAGIWIGLSVSAYWIARVLLEIPSGLISSRVGYYLPMAVGLVLSAVGNFLCAFVVDPVQLFLARVLMGLGAPLFFAVSMTLIINMFSTERRGSAMGLFQGVEFLGSTLASTFSGYIITALGFKGGFYLTTAMAAAALVLMLSPQVHRQAKTQPASANLSLSSIPKALANRGLLIICTVTFMNFILYQGVLFTVYPLYLNGNLKMPLTDIGLIQGARSLGYVLSMLLMGMISDRIGRKPVLLFGVAGTIVMTLLLNYAAGFFIILAVIFIMGITTGAVWIMCPIIAAEIVDAGYRGAAIGSYRTCFDLGSVFGPIVMIWVYDAYGIPTCFFVSAVLLIVTLLPSLRIAETKKAKPPQIQ